MGKTKSFTLMEITIVLAILILITTALFVFFNPMKEIQRGQDTKRKKELNIMRKTYEDYYTDHNCYPQPTAVCYKDQDQTYCPICGDKGGNLPPYLSALPCDPQSPEKEYLYQTDGSDCPQFYKIYAFLVTSDQKSLFKSYNYAVSSGNVALDPYPTVADPNRTDQYACYTEGCTYCCSGNACPPEDQCDESRFCVDNNGQLVGASYSYLADCQNNCVCPLP